MAERNRQICLEVLEAKRLKSRKTLKDIAIDHGLSYSSAKTMRSRVRKAIQMNNKAGVDEETFIRQNPLFFHDLFPGKGKVSAGEEPQSAEGDLFISQTGNDASKMKRKQIKNAVKNIRAKRMKQLNQNYLQKAEELGLNLDKNHTEEQNEALDKLYWQLRSKFFEDTENGFIGDGKPSDFEQPSLMPGKLEPLRLKGHNGSFHEGIREIGLPEGFVKHAKTLLLDRCFWSVPIDQLVGPIRWAGKPAQSNDAKQYSGVANAERLNVSPTQGSDICYLYPPNQDKLIAIIKALIESGLGDLLQGVPEFLGSVEKDTLIVTELCVIAMSEKLATMGGDNRPLQPDLDVDVDSTLVPNMATLLTPLDLSPSENPELITEEERTGQSVPSRKEHRCRKEAALLLKAGAFHNTNTNRQMSGKRLILCLHVGDFNTMAGFHHLVKQRKGFRMPVADKPMRGALTKKQMLEWKKNCSLKFSAGQEGVKVRFGQIGARFGRKH